MTPEEFNFIIDSQLNVCRDVLGTKAQEYAWPVDRLHNFKQAAHLQEISVKEALRGMMAKHTISVYDMIKSGKTYPMELWGEKITDHINYLLLLMAVVCEEDSTSPMDEEDAISPIDEELRELFKTIFEHLMASFNSNFNTTKEKTNA